MSKTYQIDIDGYIGEHAYSKRYVKNILKQNKGKEVLARFNSLGGNLDHGLDIAEQFAEHGNVTVYMTGFNASSSTVATLGAKKVVMSQSGFYLAHKIMNWVDAWGYMNADQMQKTIEQLTNNKQENEKMDLVLAAKYAAKSGKTVAEIMDVLKLGAWLTADEALSYGFIDEISHSDEKVNLTPQLMEKFNAFGLPLPQPPKAQTQTPETGNIAKAIAEGFTKLFTNLSNKPNNPPKAPMKKDNYQKVNSVLNAEHLEFTEGKVTLSEEQMQAIEDSLVQKDNAISEKDNAIAQRDEQIKNLKKNPGDETTTIHNDEDQEKEKENVYTRSKELYNQVEEYLI